MRHSGRHDWLLLLLLILLLLLLVTREYLQQFFTFKGQKNRHPSVYIVVPTANPR